MTTHVGQDCPRQTRVYGHPTQPLLSSLSSAQAVEPSPHVRQPLPHTAALSSLVPRFQWAVSLQAACLPGPLPLLSPHTCSWCSARQGGVLGCYPHGHFRGPSPPSVLPGSGSLRARPLPGQRLSPSCLPFSPSPAVSGGQRSPRTM